MSVNGVLAYLSPVRIVNLILRDWMPNLDTHYLGGCAVSDKAFRVVVYQEGESWIAQMLEHDICAQGPDLDTVRRRFIHTVNAEILESTKSGKKPLEGIDPAPQRFEEFWQRRSSFAECDSAAADVPLQLAIAA